MRDPQGLKPFAYRCVYVRAEARTLHFSEYSLMKPVFLEKVDRVRG